MHLKTTYQDYYRIIFEIFCHACNTKEEAETIMQSFFVYLHKNIPEENLKTFKISQVIYFAKHFANKHHTSISASHKIEAGADIIALLLWHRLTVKKIADACNTDKEKVAKQIRKQLLAYR